MIPLSLAPANSAERSRGLLFAGAVLKLQGCRGFEGEKEKREGKKKKKKKNIPRPVVQSVRGRAAVALHLPSTDNIYDSYRLLLLIGLKINKTSEIPLKIFFFFPFLVASEKHPVQRQFPSIKKDSQWI